MIMITGDLARLAINLWNWHVGDAVTVQFGSAQVWGRIMEIDQRTTRDGTEVTVVIEPDQ